MVPWITLKVVWDWATWIGQNCVTEAQRLLAKDLEDRGLKLVTDFRFNVIAPVVFALMCILAKGIMFGLSFPSLTIDQDTKGLASAITVLCLSFLFLQVRRYC